MATTEKLLLETKLDVGFRKFNGKNCWMIELLDSHESFEKIYSEVGMGNFLSLEESFIVKVPENVTILVPSTDILDRDWYLVSKQTAILFEVMKIASSSVISAISVREKVVILLNKPYKKTHKNLR